jgi:hypothetical protein
LPRKERTRALEASAGRVFLPRICRNSAPLPPEQWLAVGGSDGDPSDNVDAGNGRNGTEPERKVERLARGR